MNFRLCALVALLPFALAIGCDKKDEPATPAEPVAVTEEATPATTEEATPATTETTTTEGTETKQEEEKK